MAGEPGPDESVLSFWEDVVDDMEATAAEYRENGWDVVEIHPGNVAALTGNGDRTGLDVLVPDDEFAAVTEAVDAEGATFEDSEVFRAGAGGTVFLVVAVEDEATGTALLVPAYYAVREARELLDDARERGEIETHLHPLSMERIVTFTHGDVEPFLPPEEN